MKYVIRNMNTGKLWSGKGWTIYESKAAKFAYRMFAAIAANELNSGKGLRIEKSFQGDK